MPTLRAGRSLVFRRTTPNPLNLPANECAGEGTKKPLPESLAGNFSAPAIAGQARCLQPLADQVLSNCLGRVPPSFLLAVLLVAPRAGFSRSLVGFVPFRGLCISRWLSLLGRAGHTGSVFTGPACFNWRGLVSMWVISAPATVSLCGLTTERKNPLRFSTFRVQAKGISPRNIET